MPISRKAAARCRSPMVLPSGAGTTGGLRERQRQPVRRGLHGRRRGRCPGRAPSSAADDPATVGRVEQRAQAQLHAQRRRATRVDQPVASSECPPSAKKSSSTPTVDVPSTSAKSSARSPRAAFARRRGRPRGRERPARAARAGPACRSASAAARPAPRTRRHHVVGQPGRARSATQLAPGRRPRRGRHDVGDQPLVAGPVLRATTTASPRPPGAPQHRLDLAELDPEAADLHLVVDPAEEVQVPSAATGPGRRCGTSARRRRRTGRARTAPRSARAGRR